MLRALPVAFEYPSALWLLGLLPLFVFVARRTAAELSAWRGGTSLGLRLTVAALLILALAGPRAVRTSDAVCALFLLDVSDSIPREQRRRAIEFVNEATKHMRPGDRAGIIVFGEDARMENLPGPQLEVRAIESRPRTGHTNLARALRLATAAFGEGAEKLCVVLSDGNENLGRAADEALVAKANGVTIYALPLSARRGPEVLVDKVDLPAHAACGEPVDVRVVLRATTRTNAALLFFCNERLAGQVAAPLAPGTNLVHHTLLLRSPGFYTVRVRVNAAQDTIAQNNEGYGFVRVAGKPQVLAVASRAEDARYLADVLRGVDIQCTIAPPQALPASAAGVAAYDAVLLCDASAAEFTAEQMLALEAAVRDLGVGLGMIGGENSFGPGGYWHTPVERALPVSTEVRQERRAAAVALCLVIDNSGSMEELEDGVPKIVMANAAACEAARLLGPNDEICVIATDTNARFVVPLGKVADRSALEEQINRLRGGGGGIFVYTGISTAYQALTRSSAAVRHIILLADGSDSEQQEGCLPLARRMAEEEKITLSVVSVGFGCHSPFLEELANAGKGRFYVAQSMAQVPRIYAKETFLAARPALVEKPFFPRVDATDEPLRAIDWGSAPPLLGYVATTAKPTARVAMAALHDDPLFAHWRYGLGRAFAFTSDAKNRWAARWLSWPEFSKLWAQIVRWALRPEESGEIETTLTIDRGQGELLVEAFGEEGRSLSGLEVSATLSLPNFARRTLDLVQIAPWRYRQTFPARDVGPYVANVVCKKPDGSTAQQVVAAAVPYLDEYRALGTNRFLLSRLAEAAGGRLLRASDASAIFTAPRRATRTSSPLWPLFVLLGALLFPADVAVRRLAIGGEQVRRALEWLGRAARALRPAAKPAPAPTVSALFEAKRRALAKYSPQSDRAEERAPAKAQPEAIAQPAAAEELAQRLAEAAARAHAAKAEGEPSGRRAGDTFSRLRVAKRRARRRAEK